MSKDMTSTDRRSFLKTGALVAAPIAAIAPAAALADDGSRAKLARLEDERSIEKLHRTALRRLNAGSDCSEFLASADAVKLDPGLRRITEEQRAEPVLNVSEDGLSATYRHQCRVEMETDFTGNSTLEQMARFQGHGSHRHAEERVLETDFIKNENGWQIAHLRLA